MVLTIMFSVMMMAGLFLMLWGGVGFIQDKRFFSSAPKEIVEAVPDRKPERFKGQYSIGWLMIGLSFVLMLGAIVLGVWDGIRNDYSFWQFFLRFVIMLLGLKAFDIGFFDWVLLCNNGFHFFPITIRKQKVCTTVTCSDITGKHILHISCSAFRSQHCCHGFVHCSKNSKNSFFCRRRFS